MAEYEEQEHHGLGDEAANRLASDLVVDPFYRRSVSDLEEKYGLSLLSVTKIVDSFWIQLRVADELSVNIPCVARDGTVLPAQWLPSDDGLPSRWTRDDFRRITKVFRDNYDIVDVKAPVALDAFRKSVAGFVAAGITAGRKAQPALPVRVTTQSSGLQVNYSTAMLFDPSQVFGQTLSTPVDGYVPPGTYIFGVKRAADAVPRFDEGVYAIPPTTQANLVVA